MFKYSTGFKNAVLDNGSLKSEFENMTVKLYSGAIPATADAEETGDLLCVISGPAGANLELATLAVAGQIEKLSSQAWSGTGTSAAGADPGTAATHFRAETSSDDQSESTTLKRIQGTVGTTGGYDLQMSNANIIEGDTYTIDYFVMEFLGG